MSREIKFRVWDANEKCFPIEGEIYLFDVIKGYRKNLIAEQYTGLKDKNGKEIYEGDIVAVKDNDIPFELANALFTDRWLVRFGKHRAAFTLVKSTTRRNFIRTFQHIKTEDIEVIGNIHENPELLGGEE